MRGSVVFIKTDSRIIRDIFLNGDRELLCLAFITKAVC